jgi:hypothetical protein
MIKGAEREQWQECGETGVLIPGGNENVLWKRFGKISNSLDTKLPYDPATPRLGRHQREKKCMPAHALAHECTLFTRAKKWKPPKCPSTGK